MKNQLSIREEPIRYYCDFQAKWHRHIAFVRPKHFLLEGTGFLAIQGDAPKNFIRINEHEKGIRRTPRTWPSYIAKVGSKYYPNESITEHLVTRLGQALGMNIADSQLRIIGPQVRFLSRFFLNRKLESLVHGAELFTELLDEQFVGAVVGEKREREFFTFQVAEHAIQNAFPDHADELMEGFVRMIAFDAITGQNDRHPYNWGVVVPVRSDARPRFAPIFDSARALFWNVSERRVIQMLSDSNQLDVYIGRCRPEITWDDNHTVNHFQLLHRVFGEYPQFRANLEHLAREPFIGRSSQILDSEFRHLFSDSRRQLILECLRRRFGQFQSTVTGRS